MSDTVERTSDAVPEELDRVIIRFAGDSGDGMQLTGDRFTSVSALFGNDLATLPEFPAEIRAPAGTLAGVSAFQVHISDHDITTPGDAPNVLVAMNPAALRDELAEARAGRHRDRQRRHLRRAQPGQGRLRRPTRCTDGSLKGYTLYEVPMTSAHQAGVRAARREAARRRPLEELLRPRPHLVDVHPARRARRSSGSTRSSPATQLVRDANLAAFRAGHAFGETAELFDHPY